MDRRVSVIDCTAKSAGSPAEFAGLDTHNDTHGHFPDRVMSIKFIQFNEFGV